MVLDRRKGPCLHKITVVDLPADPNVLDRFAQAGADRAVIDLATAGKDESLDQLEKIAQAVLG